MIIPSIHRPALIGTLFAIALSIPSIAQPGPNGGKPIITYNTSGPVSIDTQSPPAFPGGEEKLVAFVRKSMQDAEQPVKMGKKTWITATIDGQGKVTSLVLSFPNDPDLQKELARIGASMPRWTPGLINKKGVETLYQFLVRR